MSDLIRRSDAIEALGECPYNWTDTDAELQEVRDWEYHKACIEAVDAVDAVSVVRCKECKYGIYTVHNMCYMCNMRGFLMYNDADFFCSYGERSDT